jgi:nucleoside 2-deoxyribosyltransferase
MRFYIATGLDNINAHNDIRDALHQLGHEITYDWTHHGLVWQDGWNRCKQVAELEAEAEGIRTADVIIVVMPGGRGTHVELGMALAYGKPVYFYSQNPEDWDPNPSFCAFYTLTTLIRDLRELVALFR